MVFPARGCGAQGTEFRQCRAVAVAYSCIINAVDELLGHLHSHSAWPRSLAGQGFVAFRRIARIEHPPVVDYLHFDPIVSYRDANLDVVGAALGPCVFYDVTHHLIERNLQLIQCLFRHPILGAHPLHRRRQSSEVGNLVANADMRGVREGHQLFSLRSV
jgi:hypothetical protein